LHVVKDTASAEDEAVDNFADAPEVIAEEVGEGEFDLGDFDLPGVTNGGQDDFDEADQQDLEDDADGD